MSCIGFTVTAHTDYRGVGVSEKIAFERACAALCAGCNGVRGKGSNELSVNRWTVKYRCKRPGDTGEFCSFGCALLITELSKN
jgi:hypothetical protein